MHALLHVAAFWGIVSTAFCARNNKSHSLLQRDPRMPAVGYMIALRPEEMKETASDIKRRLQLKEMNVVQAVKSKEIDLASLPLYTRYQMDHGRADPMNIGTRGAVGCSLSHANVWSMILNQTQEQGESAYVFEEDAVIPSHSNYLLIRDMVEEITSVPAFNQTWTILLLKFFLGFGKESVVYTRNNDASSSLTATCRDCTGYSTTGYILNKKGAKVLLKHMSREPMMVVQIDSWISLVNTYDPTFRMFWNLRDDKIEFLKAHKTTIQTDKKGMRRFSLEEIWTVSFWVCVAVLGIVCVLALLLYKRVGIPKKKRLQEECKICSC